MSTEQPHLIPRSPDLAGDDKTIPRHSELGRYVERCVIANGAIEEWRRRKDACPRLGDLAHVAQDGRIVLAQPEHGFWPAQARAIAEWILRVTATT